MFNRCFLMPSNVTQQRPELVPLYLPSDRPQWNLSLLTSYGTVLFPFRSCPLLSPHDWVVCQSCACMHVLSRSTPFIHSALIWLWDISTLWSILYSPTLIDCIMLNGAATKVWAVRQEEFMIPKFYLCLKMSCFYVCVISIYTECLIYILSVCMCVCFTIRGECLCATRYGTQTNMLLRQGGQAWN